MCEMAMVDRLITLSEKTQDHFSMDWKKNTIQMTPAMHPIASHFDPGTPTDEEKQQKNLYT
jgi:hypothetical protein